MTESGKLGNAQLSERVNAMRIPNGMVATSIALPPGEGCFVISPQQQSQTGLTFYPITIKGLDEGRTLMGTTDLLPGAGSHAVAHLRRAQQSDAALDHDTLANLGAAYLCGHIDLSPAIKEQVEKAFLPATIHVAAAADLYIKTGQQVVVDNFGSVAYGTVTIEDGGHLAFTNTGTVTIQSLIKKPKSS